MPIFLVFVSPVGIGRERGRENGSCPVAEVLKPLGFKAQADYRRLSSSIAQRPTGRTVATVQNDVNLLFSFIIRVVLCYLKNLLGRKLNAL